MKTARHAMVLDIISKYNIETRTSWPNTCAATADVTQATVSETIRSLGSSKSWGRGTYKYATVDKAESGLVDRFMRMFAHSVISISSTGTLVSVKDPCRQRQRRGGSGGFLRWPEILGSIAGTIRFSWLSAARDVPGGGKVPLDDEISRCKPAVCSMIP